MPLLRACIDCGAPTIGTRCAEHRRRPDYNHAERLRRKAVVDAYRALYGDVCPGWRRPAHPSADLTADHVVPIAAGGREDGLLAVLCRSCNSAERTRL